MKKKTLGRIALCVFALCLVSAAVASKTLAAFISSVEARGSITVANFTDLSFRKGDNSELTLSDEASFDLAATKEDNLLVKVGTIAPGDQGSFKVVLGASDVPYDYVLSINPVAAVDGKVVPITFYDAPTMAMEDLFEESLANTPVVFGVGSNTAPTEEVVHTVYWRWDTENTDPELDRDIDYENLVTTFTIDLEATQTLATP